MTIIHRRIGTRQPHVETKSSDSYDQVRPRKIQQRIESSAIKLRDCNDHDTSNNEP